MSKELITLKATQRKKLGKNANRQLRLTGYTPAVFYTPEGKSIAVQVKESALNRVFASHGRTDMFNLHIEDADTPVNQPCLIWDIEYFPTQKRFQHVDFYGVDLNKEIKIRVRLVFKGVSKGVKLGGRLEIYREEIYVVAKPQDLPSQIEVDITNLNVNQGLRIEDLVMPEGVQAHYTESFPIVLVNAPGAKLAGDDAFDELAEADEAAATDAADSEEGAEAASEE